MYYQDTEDDVNAPDRDTTEPHDSDGEDDDDEGDEEAQEDDGSAKSKRSCAGDDAEAEDEEWTDDMQQEMEDVLEHPLHPDTAFVYQTPLLRRYTLDENLVPIKDAQAWAPLSAR